MHQRFSPPTAVLLALSLVQPQRLDLVALCHVSLGDKGTTPIQKHATAGPSSTDADAIADLPGTPLVLA